MNLDIALCIMQKVCLFFAIISFLTATLFVLEPIRKATGSKALALAIFFAVWTAVFYFGAKGFIL